MEDLLQRRLLKVRMTTLTSRMRWHLHFTWSHDMEMLKAALTFWRSYAVHLGCSRMTPC
jgi:hypothetical protein